MTVLLAYEGVYTLTQNYLSWECNSLVDQPFTKGRMMGLVAYNMRVAPGVNLKSNRIAPRHIIGLSQTQSGVRFVQWDCPHHAFTLVLD